MKIYRKILALDFEMFNAMHYWSICWIGAALSRQDMKAVYFLDRKVNPAISQQLTGGSLSFPFTYKDLKKCPKFDACCRELFRLMTADTLVVGHAVDNDVKMLLTACSKYGVKCPDFDFLDTNALYGALKGEYSQMGLSALADIYDVQFTAHNPVEDAAAALEVTRRMLQKAGLTLCEAAEKYGIEIGKVRGGLVRKCTADCMGVRARLHIDNYNSVFDAAQDFAQGGGEMAAAAKLRGKKFCLENKTAVNQNTYAFVRWLYGEGAQVVFDAGVADAVLTSEIGKGSHSFVNLRDFAKEFNLPPSVAENMDFFPNKITDREGKIISYTEYLRRKYADKAAQSTAAQDSIWGQGGSSGRYYCFVHALEKRLDFEDTIERLLLSGGKISGLMSERTILVTDTPERLRTDNSDIKIRNYLQLKKGKKGKMITLSELNRRMEEGRL